MLLPYFFYWFRIDNKHMTEPWLDQSIMLQYDTIMNPLWLHYAPIWLHYDSIMLQYDPIMTPLWIHYAPIRLQYDSIMSLLCSNMTPLWLHYDSIMLQYDSIMTPLCSNMTPLWLHYAPIWPHFYRTIKNMFLVYDDTLLRILRWQTATLFPSDFQ